MTPLSPEVMVALKEAAAACRNLSRSSHLMARLTPRQIATRCVNDILALAESPAFINAIASAKAETPDLPSENSDESLVEALLALKEEGKIGQEELDATLDMESGRLRRLADRLKANNRHSESA